MTAARSNIAGASDNAAPDVLVPSDDILEIEDPAESEDAGSGDPGQSDDVVRQRKRGLELEAAIRSACVAELACEGYGSLTIESVASRAQTGKASIYRRWPTKLELVLDSVMDLMAGPLMRLSERDYDDTVTTRDALLDVMAQVGEIMAGPQGDAIRSVLGESLRDPSFSGCFECDFYDPRKQALVNLLARGVRRGEVRPDAADEVVADVIAGAMIHRVLVRRKEPTMAELERMLDGFIIPAIRAEPAG
jgi:AcrR family transcriptional regulator